MADQPKPEAGKPEEKIASAKSESPKHTEAAKPVKVHATAKPAAKTKTTKSKTTKAKHTDPKHAVKKSTPKPHPGTTNTGL
jgi:hypothetical protein